MSALPMPIKCVAAWAGGKRRLAKRIVELLGPHDTYVEPFVGGCSILPAKPASDSEYVYDRNPDVIDAVRTLAHSRGGGWVAERLAARPFAKEVFDAAAARLATPPAEYPVGIRALDLLTVWWQGPGGIAGTARKGWFARRHTKTGGCPAKRWASFVASVPALATRLQHVVANVADGIAVLEQSAWMDRAGTALYCDPPYLTKSFKYAADFAPADHQRLADVMNSLRHARAVVSYYDDGQGTLARLYPPSRWRRIDVEMSKNMSAAGGKTGRAVEVLLVNDAGGN